GLDLGLLHTENRTVQKNVLAPCQFRVESSANFKEAGHSSAHSHRTFRRVSDSRKDFEESALACPVRADDGYRIALFNVEIYIPQSPQRRCGGIHLVFAWLSGQSFERSL